MTEPLPTSAPNPSPPSSTTTTNPPSTNPATFSKMPPPIPLTLIVAATRSTHGIGHRGTLPWPTLKQEMAYFARVTRHTPAPNTLNAVIMGRKTWSSIPVRFRPLRGRINVVLTRQGSSGVLGDGANGTEEAPVVVAGSVGEGLRQLTARFGPVGGGDGKEGEEQELHEDGGKRRLGRVFVIGGGEIYGLALGLEPGAGPGWVDRVLWTSVERPEFECDTLFPEKVVDGENWVRSREEEWRNWTGEGKEMEGRMERRVERVKNRDGVEVEVEYRFGMYQRVRGG